MIIQGPKVDRMRKYARDILLWLFGLDLGIAFGAGIYEGKVVVRQWEDTPPQTWPNTGLQFWVFVTTVPLTLLTLASPVAAWQDQEPRGYWWLAMEASELRSSCSHSDGVVGSNEGVVVANQVTVEACPSFDGTEICFQRGTRRAGNQNNPGPPLKDQYEALSSLILPRHRHGPGLPLHPQSVRFASVLDDLNVSHLINGLFSGLLGGKPSTIGPKASRPGTDPHYCPSGEAGCSETQQGAIRRPGA